MAKLQIKLNVMVGDNIGKIVAGEFRKIRIYHLNFSFLIFLPS